MTVEATNAGGVDSQTFTVEVVEAVTPAAISSLAVTEGIVNQAYSYDVEASGYPAPTYGLTAAPAGMVIDGVSGLMSWTPGTVGSYGVTVEATNAGGVDSQTFTVEVVEAVTPAAISSLAVTEGIVNQAYSYDVEASGYPAPTYGLTAAPAGMVIDGVSGLIGWTPETAGSYGVTVEATTLVEWIVRRSRSRWWKQLHQQRSVRWR